MANKKFTDLTSASSVANTDILAVTINPGGTPESRKVEVDVLMANAPVQSVNSATGAVVLDADNIDDTTTTNKFVTASDITNLSNLSGTNTGDQDLSSYQLQPTEGAFVDGDKTKLDGIEASADVTDATNVEAAGALMDSEVTNLAEVKAFSSADYATSAQGTTADSATQPGDNISTLTNDSGFITGLSAGALSDFDFDDNPIFGFGASVNTPTITANAYTLTDADNGKVLALDNGATAMTVNIDTGLVSGFNCSFIQAGSGQVTFAGTATLNNRQSHTKIYDQYGVASIVAYATDTYILVGDTTS